ncbi:helix-turn-helix domain-containing protein [Phyllobacterium myrsinacearum]|uniref:XRE family transcriptional regulator n=1 Tax=Phyllobacterium myrsinacearum TaxID=28101 RepID=A0A2S9JIV4_9HYPH|nr:helix-turn-helix transcriptional regulator [Phyllobacterium myrsinacearum]PRD53033.1 XRE family transcriptional regulator [Phyllobacterium myrsinacearum]PWV94129.1 helix-turn-helix protein [Phyllobacterium myrsinacearum]RZV07432.1 helix-turn-helix protein [Phyllobacterium myrsinacearum]
MDDLRTRFGRLVAVHRRKAGMTQDALAEAAGVSVDMISKIETGASGARFPLIERLAQALSVDPAEFFTAELPSQTNRNPLLSSINVTLAGLDQKNLLWINGLIKAALNQKK